MTVSSLRKKFLYCSRPERKAILISLILHLFFVLFVLSSTSQRGKERELIIIDFRITQLDLSDREKGGFSDDSKKGNNLESPGDVLKNIKESERVPEEGFRRVETLQERKSEAVAEVKHADEKTKGPSSEELSEAQMVSAPRGQIFLAGSGTRTEPGEQNNTGPSKAELRDGGKPRARDEEANRYLRENFQYIREIIARNTFYPPLARRMGWTGRVTLSFTVTEDGSIRDLQIIEPSGYEILDRSAMETVRRSAPFPKPPTAVRVIIPIVYKLN